MYLTDSSNNPSAISAETGLPFASFAVIEERSFFARLILFAIGFHIDRQKLLHRRHDDLLRVDKQLRVADHRGAEIDVRNMLLFDRQLDQFRRAGDVDQLVTVEIFAFDAEQHVAIVGWNRQHHRRRLSGAERIFVDDDLDAVVTIAKIGGRVGGDEDVGLRLDRRQEAIALGSARQRLTALPRDAIVAFALGREIAIAPRLRRRSSPSA